MGAINVADILTMQDLANGHLDVKALGEAANGDENTIVTTRTGNTYPSAERAINIMFKNGGLPAKPFETLAQMQTEGASLADGQLAQVYNEAVNNGLYVKTGGAWVKSDYDPAYQSKKYSDVAVKSLRDITYITRGDDTHHFADKDGDVIALISADGSLRLTALADSVQSEITANKIAIADRLGSDNLLKSGVQDRTHVLSDADGGILFEMYSDGAAYFYGLNKDLVSTITDIQNSTSGDSIKDTSIAELRSYKDTFIPPAQCLMNNLVYSQSGAKAPPPMDFFPQNFTLNKTWINSIGKISHSTSNRLSIDTPYHTDGGVVHPNIIEFYNGFRGYRYLVCITPYQLTNEAEENPCIYGTNDLINFQLLDGFTQPLDDRPQPDFSTGHNSDNVFTYDPKTGELICVWRQSLRNPVNDGIRTDALWMRKTKDGYTWSDKERIYLNTKSPVGSSAGSPAFLYDVKTDYWYLYVTTLAVSRTSMRLFRAKTLNEDAWEVVAALTLPFDAWHHEVKFVGDKVVMMAYEYLPNDAIYVGISDNFKDFTWSTNILDENNGYKASFVPVFDTDNKIALKILYTTNASPASDSEKWRMYSTTTNFIDAAVTVV